MALRFFEHPLSPYARKVKIVLAHKGIAFERVFVNPMERDTPAFREFVRASPRLEVPCLVDDDGTAVFDSTVMLEYVEEKWPAPPSLPASPAARARVRMLEELCDTELEAVNWGLMEIRFFRRAEGEEADAILAKARAQLGRLWARLDRELEGRAWMNGEAFGRGDAAVYPHVTGSAFFGMPLDPNFARLSAWAARCAEQPAVRGRRAARDVDAREHGRDGGRDARADADRAAVPRPPPRVDDEVGRRRDRAARARGRHDPLPDRVRVRRNA